MYSLHSLMRSYIASKVQNLYIGSKKITTVSKDIDKEKIMLISPFLQPPDLLTTLYLYFYYLLQENARVCPVCLGPNNRKINAKTCSPKCHEVYKKRNMKKESEK